MNHCPKWEEFNFYNSENKIPFSMIFTDDPTDLESIIKNIQMVWNIKNGMGSLNIP